MTRIFCARFLAILVAALLLTSGVLPRVAAAHEHAPAMTDMASPRGHHHSSTPSPGQAGNDCLCCTLGQCSMVTASLPDRSAELALFAKRAAPYQGFVVAIADGLAINPTPPPPRLNA